MKLKQKLNNKIINPGFKKADEVIFEQIIKLAQAYPYRHNVLGGVEAQAYVRKTAVSIATEGEGWYAITQDDEVLAAVQLCIYCSKNKQGHTLWKIRHPLSKGDGRTCYLRLLFENLVTLVKKLYPGSAKFVIFLSEYERDAVSASCEAGFSQEACFTDYYRLGEKCFVYSRTVI